MAPTIGTLLDRFQGFFSKSYFIGGFLPVVLFLFINALLLSVTFPAGSVLLFAFIDSSFSEKVVYGSTLLLLVFALGLIVTSLNPWFRQFMEGYYLFGSTRQWFISRQLQLYSDLNGEKQRILPEVFRFRRALKGSPSWTLQLQDARKLGEKTSYVPLTVDPLLQALTTALIPLERSQNVWDVIPYASLATLLPDLIRALETRPASKIPQLDELHTKFLALLNYAADRIEVSYRLASAELALRFPQDRGRIGPTRLANLVELHREYSLIRYGLDVEKHWLKVSKFVNQDATFQPILEDAKTQLDFSVAIVALTLITTVIWMPLTAIFAANFYPYLAVAGMGLPLVAIFHVLVIQNYRTFTEAARSAIDLYHFDLISALHLPLPKTPKDELELWGQVEANDPQLIYKHEDSEDEAPPPPKKWWQKLIDYFQGK